MWDMLLPMSDQPPTNHPGHVQDETDRPPTTPAMVSLKEAATTLGISVNAVRQRIKRGTLEGVKTSAGWLVDPTPTTDRPPTTSATTPMNVVATTDQPPTNHPVDLSPLVDEMRDLRKENAQLHSMAGWLVSQNVALRQEVDRLRMIEANVATPEPQNGPQGDGDEHADRESPAARLGGLWTLVRRLITR
jgi:DNA-binding Lrp family transcriptional regulator